MFLPIRQLILYAARRIAADPRARAKAAEVLETEIKDIARETRPLKHPGKFAAKLKERLREGEEEDQGGSDRDT